MAETGLVAPIDGALLRRLPRQNVLIRDAHLRGFQLRVRVSERRGITATYRVQLARGRVESLGRVGVWKLSEAREEAQRRLWRVSLKLELPRARSEPPTLRAF